MDRLISEADSWPRKMYTDAIEELSTLGLSYGAHSILGNALGKLAAYEEAGLSPEQVEKLKFRMEQL